MSGGTVCATVWCEWMAFLPSYTHALTCVLPRSAYSTLTVRLSMSHVTFMSSSRGTDLPPDGSKRPRNPREARPRVPGGGGVTPQQQQRGEHPLG